MTTTKIVLGILAMMAMLVIPSMAQENETNVSTMNNTTMNNSTEWINFVDELEVMPENNIVRPLVIELGSISQDPQSLNDPRVTKLSGTDPAIFETPEMAKTPGGVASEYGTDEQLRFLNA